MASNLVIARGGTELIPPISLAFWRWTLCFLILLPFTISYLKKNFYMFKDELIKLFILGFLGCGICGAFPFLAGKTTTIVNMGIIIFSSVGGILLFKEKLSVSNWSGIVLAILAIVLIM